MHTHFHLIPIYFIQEASHGQPSRFLQVHSNLQHLFSLKFPFHSSTSSIPDAIHCNGQHDPTLYKEL